MPKLKVTFYPFYFCFSHELCKSPENENQLVSSINTRVWLKKKKNQFYYMF